MAKASWYNSSKTEDENGKPLRNNYNYFIIKVDANFLLRYNI